MYWFRLLTTKIGCPALMLKHSSKTTTTLEVTPATLSATLARCSTVSPAATVELDSATEASRASGVNGKASSSGQSSGTPNSGQDRKTTAFDPPEGSARRPGTSKVFSGKGEAVYWPRMPCLRCGCPWWLGEDWDALCVRCGWCCESEGYDDDSKPLRTGGWLERYEEFTTCLKQGYTAPWPPKGLGKGKGKDASKR